MQLLDNESNVLKAEDECVALVLETVPHVMGVFRAEMRKHKPADMSVPQFRTLIYLHKHHGVSLSEVAEHMGLTLPSASKLIDGLVKKIFVAREVSPEDRRRATLSLTAEGQAALQRVRHDALAQMASMLATLNEDERIVMTHAMRILQRVVTPGREGETTAVRE